VILRPSIRSAEVHRDTRCAPTWRANYRGSLPLIVNLYRSCVGLGWLAQETMGFRLVRASRSNTQCPVSSCRVLGIGVLVVGVTSWLGEGVEPNSLEVAFDLYMV
jgi:hypothetical protein